MAWIETVAEDAAQGELKLIYDARRHFQRSFDRPKPKEQVHPLVYRGTEKSKAWATGRAVDQSRYFRRTNDVTCKSLATRTPVTSILKSWSFLVDAITLRAIALPSGSKR